MEIVRFQDSLDLIRYGAQQDDGSVLLSARWVPRRPLDQTFIS